MNNSFMEESDCDMTKSEFKKLLERGRKAHIKAELITNELFDKLEQDMGLRTSILSDIPSNAENADNLKEAIQCYMQYGEYDSDLLWDELIMGNAAHS